MGISVHTGWAACVVIEGDSGGGRAQPTIIASEVIEILPDAERFCFHAAAALNQRAAAGLIAKARRKALYNADRALASLDAHCVAVCAIVAREGEPGSLDEVLASHPRIHTAEGFFYRDVLREACRMPVHLVPPSELDPSRIGKLAGPPWGRDQKLATLAAWRVISGGTPASTA
jgi:hypothetical protein